MRQYLPVVSLLWSGLLVGSAAAVGGSSSAHHHSFSVGVDGGGGMDSSFVSARHGNRTEIARLMGLKQELKAERLEEERDIEETTQKRRSKAREKLKSYVPSNIQEITPEELERMKNDQKERKLSWFGGSDVISENAIDLGMVVDPANYMDKWSQGYRYLGVFIDCDNSWGGDDEKHRRRRSRRRRTMGEEDGERKMGEEGGEHEGGGGNGCSRWMMWASYYNPNYQGNEYNEYHGNDDESPSQLDCHKANTEWELIGVYRQEFYQYIEQISKHLWAIDDYEYVVARAGLLYMTDYECFAVGATSGGATLYGNVAPRSQGKFEMGLYLDDYCLEETFDYGTYDDFYGQTEMDLGSKDADDYDDSYMEEWWYDAQEYTLTNLNEVYSSFMYCTHCMDYPTYQDGYFIGDDGTDDDDLINQCWKFHSHDSFICEADCIAKGNQQGTITQIRYGDNTYGSRLANTEYQADATVLVESPWSRIMANAFLTFSFLLFVATFLAFAVARRSRYRESRSAKSRRLLDDDDEDGAMDARSKRSRRSRSKRRRKKDGESDGLFRTSPSGDGRSRRSKSRTKRSSSGARKSSSSRRSSSRPKRDRSSSGRDRDGGDQEKKRERERSRSQNRNSERLDNF